MSETDKFTSEDMENDGYFKTQLQDSMKNVAAREHSEMWQYFQVVCEDQAPPEVVLAAAAVKALNNDRFAERVLETEPEIETVKKSQHRMEDMKYVQRMYEELGMDDGGSDLQDAITKKLESEIVGNTESPLEKLTETLDEGAQEREENERLDEIERKLDRIVEGESETVSTDSDEELTPEEREEDIDSLLEEDEIEYEHDVGTDIPEEDDSKLVYPETEDEFVEDGETNNAAEEVEDGEETKEETADVEEVEEMDKQPDDGDEELEGIEEEWDGGIEEEWEDEGEGEDWDIDEEVDEE